MSTSSPQAAKILVITPTLGRSPWLQQTVESVAAVLVRGEHLLVAPASEVAALQARFPKTRVVAEREGGLYAAINAGLAAVVNWAAFTYLNDDDVLRPNFRSVVSAVGAAGAPLVAYGRVELIDARGKRVGAIPISPFPSLNRALYAQRIEPVYQHGTLVTRTALEQCGGVFDDSFRFCGDSEFLARACVRGVPFRRVGGGAVAAFRLRAGQLTKNRAAMLAERRRVDEKLGLVVAGAAARQRWAKWVFRIWNGSAYAERIARHGFVSFDEVLAGESRPWSR